MLYFSTDYQEGAHEQILRRLLETNLEPLSGYGADRWCESARSRIRAACECPEADIYFLTGGTQTNQLVIDVLLAPYEGVVAAESGHVSIHEAGAIEYTGHKVLTLPQHEGKLRADELELLLERFRNDENQEHMVSPGMVYLSYPTEFGTLYSRSELAQIASICKSYGLSLYLDGARLGYGLASPASDLTLPDLARLCDVFYIGGTKVGALCGEAVVFPKGRTPAHLLTRIKQHGALLAKGRLLGIQFDTLFTDELYLKISRRAVDMAYLLKEGLTERGCTFLLDSPTNQQFLILPDRQMERLKEQVAFSFWEKYDPKHTVIRLATSWATTEEQVQALIRLF